MVVEQLGLEKPPKGGVIHAVIPGTRRHNTWYRYTVCIICVSIMIRISYFVRTILVHTRSVMQIIPGPIVYLVYNTANYTRNLQEIFYQYLVPNIQHIVGDSRSPLWTSGSPPMLLVLIREFESCLPTGEILKLFAKIKKRINC